MPDDDMVAVRETEHFRDLSPSVWRLLEERADAFEAAWVRGDRPSIPDYLIDPDPTAGQLLVELVYADFEFRLRAGESVRADDYFAAYPALADRPAVTEGLAVVECNFAPAVTMRSSRGNGSSIVGSRSDRIDAVRDSFEEEWKSGGRPRIEDFLSGSSEPERSTIFLYLLATEVSFRQSRSESPAPDEYASRFPEYAARLDAIPWDVRETNATSSDPGARRFGHFELMKELGTGGFGTVWKARDRILDRIVALKIPHPHRMNSVGRALLVREARAAACLRHPNIVGIHAASADGELVYIAYDYVDGVNLHQRLATTRPSPREAAEICLTLAQAVQHAHDCGVIHRDLKPGNVLVDRDGGLHVTDFGLAKRAFSDDSLTRDGLVAGSLPYMSPEQAAGKSRAADARTDVYGLGVILYELLTGGRPFDGEDATVLRQIVEESPPDPRRIKADIPRSLEAICLKAIEKEPRRRYATAAALAADLDRFLRGEKPAARPRGMIARSLLTSRRRGRVALAALVPSIALLAAWGAVDLRSDRGTKQERASLPFAARPVEIRTDPPGAEIWVIPHDPITGRVQAERRLGGDGEYFSPARFDLPPGEYLIVADLGEDRFVEVVRRIPPPGETTAFSSPSVDWNVDGDTLWFEFDVPSPPPMEEFVLVPGGEFIIEDGEITQRVFVPSFYLARRELTFGEYRAIKEASVARSSRPSNPAGLPWILSDLERAVDDSVPLTYAAADSILGKAALRFPDEIEWAYAATCPLPIDDVDGGLAEWTSSWYGSYHWASIEQARLLEQVMLRSVSPLDFFQIGNDHVVRGGGPELQSLAPAGSRAILDVGRFPWQFQESHAGIGVRAARSVKPRKDPQDFPHLVGSAGVLTESSQTPGFSEEAGRLD